MERNIDWTTQLSKDVSLTKVMYGFNGIPIKILEFFLGIGRLALKYTWKSIGPRIVKTTILTKKKVGSISALILIFHI